MFRLVALCLVLVASGADSSEKEDWDKFLDDYGWTPSDEAHDESRVDHFLDSGKHYADHAARYADNVSEHLHDFLHNGLQHTSKEANDMEKAGVHYAKDARKAAREGLAEAREARDEYAGNVSDRVHELIHHSMETSAKRAQDMREEAFDYAQHARNIAQKQVAQAQDRYAGNVSERVHELVKGSMAETAKQAKDMQHQGLHYAKRAHDMVQKRVDQAESTQDAFAADQPDLDPAMGLVSFAAVDDEAWHNSSEVAQALADQRSAAQRAQDSIDELRQWDEKLKADLKNKNFSRHVASGIVTKVQTGFVEQRAKLHASFDAAVDALHSQSLDVTNKTAVDEATKAADKVADDLRHLDHLESKAMRATLHSIEKSGKRRARSIWKVAKQAAKEAYHSGMAVAKAQRKAGAKEHVYERTEGHAEKVSERLLGHAEHAAERAEDLVERQFDKVEHHLEHIMDELVHESKHQRESRLHHARQQIHERKEAAEAAARAAKQEEATKPAVQDHQGQPAQREPASSAFLAKRETSDLSLTLLAPLACVMGLGAVSFLLLASRIWRQGPVVEQPLLG